MCPFFIQFDELSAKGNFEREDIINALTSNEGNFDAAFQELNKLQLKPFLMKVWGQPEAGEVTSGAAKEPPAAAALTAASAGAAASGQPTGEITSEFVFPYLDWGRCPDLIGGGEMKKYRLSCTAVNFMPYTCPDFILRDITI